MGEREFEEMKNVDICTVDRADLVDISEIKVDQKLSKKERLADFVQRVKNPFCYLCNGVVVKVSYRDDGGSLEDRLTTLCMAMEDRPDRSEKGLSTKCSRY